MFAFFWERKTTNKKLPIITGTAKFISHINKLTWNTCNAAAENTPKINTETEPRTPNSPKIDEGISVANKYERVIPTTFWIKDNCGKNACNKI